ncbi:MAG: Citrate synthase 1 [Chlamydiales bacterium]|nr:Citrate synthase 1 [Chlamydiales bacterium]MCH9636071.1 Citrate synthase 1 [Chlamydiales bacterium]
MNDIFSIDQEGDYTLLRHKKPAQKLLVYDPGLYHTAICESHLCHIDTFDGKLYYRGEAVETKIEQDYLDVAYELIFGEVDEKKERFLAAAKFELLDEQRALLDVIPRSTHPMDVLAMAVTNLGGLEHKYLADPADLAEKAGFLISQVAVTVAYRYAGEYWEVDSSLPYAEQILRHMHRDKKRVEELGRILNTIMILHAEHGQNCSAVTVRCVASARGSLYTGVASGMASFNGVIHGGASQFVSAMYEELIESGLDVDSYVNRKLEKRELLMGFGQRTYNRIEGCWDPRVETMHRILTDDSFDFPEVKAYRDAAIALIERVKEEPFFKERNLTPNPDLFNCIFYKLFEAPRQMNTTMLALGRIAGWIANFVEHTEKRYPLTRPGDISVE